MQRLRRVITIHTARFSEAKYLQAEYDAYFLAELRSKDGRSSTELRAHLESGNSGSMDIHSINETYIVFGTAILLGRGFVDFINLRHLMV